MEEEKKEEGRGGVSLGRRRNAVTMTTASRSDDSGNDLVRRGFTFASPYFYFRFFLMLSWTGLITIFMFFFNFLSWTGLPETRVVHVQIHVPPVLYRFER